MKYLTKNLKKYTIMLIACCLCLQMTIQTEADTKYAANTNAIVVDGYTIHHLSDDGICGATQFRGDNIDYEGFAGLKVQCNKNTVEYTMYSHSSSFRSGIVSIMKNGDHTILNLGNIKVDESKSFDITDIIKQLGTESPIGLYTLKLMTGTDNMEPVSIWLYYDGSIVKTCRYNMNNQSDISAWNAVIGNLDPNTCLDMYVGSQSNPITYPTSGQNGNCNHVQEWCDLSDKIIIHDDWTDEAKVFAMVLYMTRNYSYDDYRVQTLHNKSRATEADVWNDDNLWMYYNKTGQCWDFANTLCIMCRHQGIPCTSVENNGHTVNAVWLRGEWVAIDISVLTPKHCYTKDTDPKNWRSQRDSCYRNSYGYYDSTMETYNQAIATPETTLTYRSGKNPM